MKRQTVLPKLHSNEQHRKFITAMPNDMYKLLCKVFQTTGMRLYEALAMNTHSIDWNRGHYTLGRQKNRYDNEPIVIRPETMQMLKWYSKKYHHKIEQCNGYIFYSMRTKGHIKHSAVHTIFKKYRRIAGIDDVYKTARNGYQYHKFTPHSFRHRFANDCVHRMIERHGMLDTKSLQLLMRHKSEASLNSYILASTELKEKIMRSLFN